MSPGADEEKSAERGESTSGSKDEELMVGDSGEELKLMLDRGLTLSMARILETVSVTTFDTRIPTHDSRLVPPRT